VIAAIIGALYGPNSDNFKDREATLAECASRGPIPFITSHVIEQSRRAPILLIVSAREDARENQTKHRRAYESHQIQESYMQATFVKKEPPRWLLDMWKEIDDKTFGKGFDCFADDAVCNLGIADWKGREAIRNNLKAFVDTGFTALHHVTEYWDAGFLKVFRGVVDMTPDDRSKPTVHPTMTHFFYMDEKDDTKVRRWVGAVGPVSFG
jgi:hypothetical protein